MAAKTSNKLQMYKKCTHQKLWKGLQKMLENCSVESFNNKKAQNKMVTKEIAG